MLAVDQWDVSKFWSEDFVSGITAFIVQVNDSIACIEREVQFYQWFIKDWSTPLLHELGKKVQDINLVEHEALSELLASLKRSNNVEQLEAVCLEPLQSILKKAKRWRDEMERVLKPLQSEYLRDVKAMREALDMYNRKAKASPAVKTTEEQVVNAPIELDEHLRFADEIELRAFLERLKQSMPVQKKAFINYLGFEGKCSFQGKQLMESIKKNSEKLDTSPFNLDRLGQKLLDLDLLREEGLAITTGRPFNQEAYYGWVESSKDKNTLGGWVKGFSTTAIDNTALDTLETRYFEKCCKLEFSKYELEKAIYESVVGYTEFSVVEIGGTFRRNREVFSKLYAHARDDTDSTSRLEPSSRCYLRNSRVAVVKWESLQNSLTRRTMMMGSDDIDDDAVEAIHVILTHVEGFSEDTDLKKRVSKAWRVASAMEMSRAINLKIEFIRAFRDTSDTTNVKSLRTMIRSKRFSVANDWIGLVQLWLLELPNSLIPPQCIESIMKNDDDSWLDRMPTNNLRVLSDMCRHFQWMGQDFAALQEPVSHYFMRRADCIRNFPEDFKRFEPWVVSFLTEPASRERLQQAITDKKTVLTAPPTPSLPAIQVLDLEHPTTPPSAEPNESFQPRPFRTASAASSVPGSPVPSRASRRISGLIIEAPELTSDPSRVALN